jgi:hypothetical protein
MVVAMKINQLLPETVTEAKNARQVFLMVAELHKLGYEGLRVTPFHSPSGCYWWCCIVPASMTHLVGHRALNLQIVFTTSGFNEIPVGKGILRAQNHRGKTPGAGRRVQSGAQPDEASNRLTRRPAT